MKEYLLHLIGAALITGAAGLLLEKRLSGRAVKTVCAFVLLSALLSYSGGKEDWFSFAEESALIRQEGERLAAQGAEEGRIQTRAGIEKRLNEYIWDKAEALDLEVREARVTTVWSDKEVWVPVSVRLEVSGSAWEKTVLGRWLESELGIAPDRQEWVAPKEDSDLDER